jgi:phage host-nuclease inhibitor protein Gam
VDWLLGREPLAELSAPDQDRFIQEVRDKGREMTDRVTQTIYRRLDAMRGVPPAHHAKLREDINTLLDQYQSWCAANQANESAALTAALAARDGSENAGGEERTEEGGA